MVVTANVDSPEQLSEHIGVQTASRVLEMCEPIPLFGNDKRVEVRSSVREA
jgi:hypothetical protein